MLKKSEFHLKQFVLYFIFILFSLSIIYPLFWILSNSLKTNKEFYNNTFSLPGHPEIGNYLQAWKEGISLYYLNSIIVTVITVILILLVSTLAAYAVTRFPFKYKKILLGILLGGMFVSPQTAVLPLYHLLRDLRIYDTYVAMIIPILAFRISFSIFLLFPAFHSFPKELEEAAVLDGCSSFEIYRKIMLPVCRPAVTVCLLLNLIYTWNEFTFSLNFISTEKYYTIPIGLMSFSQALYTDWVVLLSGIVLAIVPVLVLFIAFQKYFVAGLTVGSVKE
ncbi:carbohydrate ABC transporter permease [Hungatella hathewayi]|uniref:Carbohydrate ABC transporter permease n=1 Tax=Hungatella hathewayi TaxID=154046 RepID=A0A3E2X1E3_9FIRM|nr:MULTISPECIES: carbohydrate ABC transporter permease [Clostridia]RGC35101.1 carbohydrate ABC transporter permease [Hungatella hathewayi]GKH34374.1 putative ABC transporter permease protein YurM [Faecalicatena contorta]